LCRFVSVDPLQFDYPYYTPFQYAGNKPITYIDLDGLESQNVVQEGEIGQQGFDMSKLYINPIEKKKVWSFYSPGYSGIIHVQNVGISAINNLTGTMNLVTTGKIFDLNYLVSGIEDSLD
jgi:hypothetical protein